jgi:2-polyprenyl-3-methyl-5-hydroxy-6-metoxy-1,4-benzoquinol methylase
MIHYTTCPVCGGQHIHPQLNAVDHTVSQETFAIWHCDDCTLRFTQDVPNQDAIGAYYQSDNYISHSDSKKGLINNLYHKVRVLTLAGKRKMVLKYTSLQKGKILDIGCGTGAFLNSMQTAGWDITALEPDPTARLKAKELYGIQPDPPGKLFELRENGYNAVTMWHVLEHVHELHAYMEKISKLLAPGGKLFIAVPNYTSKDAAAYGANWAAYDVPRHLYHFSPQSMELLAGKHGLKIAAYKPMWFDSYYVSMLSEKYKDQRGNLLKAGWNGTLSNFKALGDAKNCSSVIYILGRG